MEKMSQSVSENNCGSRILILNVYQVNIIRLPLSLMKLENYNSITLQPKGNRSLCWDSQWQEPFSLEMLYSEASDSRQVFFFKLFFHEFNPLFSKLRFGWPLSLFFLLLVYFPLRSIELQGQNCITGIPIRNCCCSYINSNYLYHLLKINIPQLTKVFCKFYHL